jgi:hypothetical protein
MITHISTMPISVTVVLTMISLLCASYKLIIPESYQMRKTFVRIAEEAVSCVSGVCLLVVTSELAHYVC